MNEEKIAKELDDAKKEILEWFSSDRASVKDKLYAFKHAHWTKEKQLKNKFIRSNYRQESVQRKRKEIYWCSIGMNVGSELSEDHFVVVVKEYPTVAVVVPLSSVKLNNNKSELIGYYEIGPIQALPENSRENFAVISQIKTISKKRLSTYKDKFGTFHTIKLSDQQMDIVDRAILDSLTKLESPEIISVAVSEN